MTDGSPDRPIVDDVPWSDQLTDYDRDHIQLYLRLLDAESEGTNPFEIVRFLLDLDPGRDPDRARRRLESHLKRAHWMVDNGYRILLSPSE